MQTRASHTLERHTCAYPHCTCAYVHAYVCIHANNQSWTHRLLVCLHDIQTVYSISYVRKANGDYRPQEVMVLITKLSLS